ncbi:hypothetical protein [Pseudomonas sp. 22 E 5]|nr:hypothetical protein [Pseudomonas sp. 22 E 5]
MCDFRILCRQLSANGCMHILRLLWCSSQPGTNGPDRLVSNYCLCKRTNTQLLDNAAKLTRDNLKSFARFALLKGFPYAQHRNQATSLCRCELAIECPITLAHHLTALGVPDKHIGTTRINQLTRCNLTGQGTLHGFHRRILRADLDRLTFQAINHLGDMQARRENRDINTARQGQVTKAVDQLSDTGAGTVHLPVTSYHSATHAVPRRSKWAQMLPNHIITGKPNSDANFSY